MKIDWTDQNQIIDLCLLQTMRTANMYVVYKHEDRPNYNLTLKTRWDTIVSRIPKHRLIFPLPVIFRVGDWEHDMKLANYGPGFSAEYPVPAPRDKTLLEELNVNPFSTAGAFCANMRREIISSRQRREGINGTDED